MSQGVNILPDDKGNPPQFQLSGRNAIEIPVFNALAITDTNPHLSSIIDLSAYRSVTLWGISTLDQNPMVKIKQETGISSSVFNYLAWYTGSAWDNTNSNAPTLSLNGVPMNLNTYYTFLDTDIIRRVEIELRCTATAPTTGSASVWFEGVPN